MIKLIFFAIFVASTVAQNELVGTWRVNTTFYPYPISICQHGGANTYYGSFELGLWIGDFDASTSTWSGTWYEAGLVDNTGSFSLHFNDSTNQLTGTYKSSNFVATRTSDATPSSTSCKTPTQALNTTPLYAGHFKVTQNPSYDHYYCSNNTHLYGSYAEGDINGFTMYIIHPTHQVFTGAWYDDDGTTGITIAKVISVNPSTAWLESWVTGTKAELLTRTSACEEDSGACAYNVEYTRNGDTNSTLCLQSQCAVTNTCRAASTTTTTTGAGSIVGISTLLVALAVFVSYLF